MMGRLKRRPCRSHGRSRLFDWIIIDCGSLDDEVKLFCLSLFETPLLWHATPFFCFLRLPSFLLFVLGIFFLFLVASYHFLMSTSRKRIIFFLVVCNHLIWLFFEIHFFPYFCSFMSSGDRNFRVFVLRVRPSSGDSDVGPPRSLKNSPFDPYTSTFHSPFVASPQKGWPYLASIRSEGIQGGATWP